MGVGVGVGRGWAVVSGNRLSLEPGTPWGHRIHLLGQTYGFGVQMLLGTLPAHPTTTARPWLPSSPLVQL